MRVGRNQMVNEKGYWRRRPDGTIQYGGEHTNSKYQILEKYLYSLSLIVGKKGWTHYFIDACAGSGKVCIDNELVDGSPLIMAKTREKAKRPSLRCRFIESHPKTYERLVESVEPYSDFSECILGDSNVELDRILDKVSTYQFAFVFFDPFGLGSPTIQRETVKRLMEREHTEIMMNYSWMAVTRMAGHLKRIPHDSVSQSVVDTLDLFHGEWQDLERRKFSSTREKSEAFVELYVREWREYYSFINYIEIPIGSKSPIYYLIFTTRNEIGNKIQREIIEKERRRGAESLEKWFKQARTYNNI